MMIRGIAIGLTVIATVAAVSAQTPAPGSSPATFDVAAQMQSQFSNARRLLIAAADRMPADAYGFKPMAEMRSFGASVAHVAQSNFGYCANLTGTPAPHHGENLEMIAVTKDAATAVLKESFDYCATFASSVTTEKLNETYTGQRILPDGTKSPLAIARGGLFSNLIAHSNEMYGYLSTYLRLKGLVPPSSDPRRARGGDAGPR
jgi:uncharacterized damage-inducible protein DinB